MGMCGVCRAALRCPGWPQAIARAARSGLDSTRRAAWHRAGRSPLRFVVRSLESDDRMMTFFSSVEVIRPQLLDRNARPERVGEQSLPQAMRKTRIARRCRCVHRGRAKRDSCRRAWSTKRPAGAETGGRYGRALPVFFPIGHRGGAIAFTPSGAAFEISRPPPPSQAPGPISQKSLSWHGITPPLGSSCTPRPSGQYVPTGQKPT